MRIKYSVRSSTTSWCTWNNDTDTDETKATCANQSKLNTINTTTPITTITTNNANIYSYGNYYNWYSATAGNGTYATNTGSTNGDICPSNWQLPLGGQTNTFGSFSNLDTIMGGTGAYQGTATASRRWQAYPYNFLFSGNWHGGSVYDRSTCGLYWSRTAYSAPRAYNLTFYASAVYPGTGVNYKFYGFSVRCVAGS